MREFFTQDRSSRFAGPAAFILMALLGPAPAIAAGPANPYAPDTAEPGSVEAIAQDTTEPRFMSPWVAYVPASATVPSPAQFLGHVAGAAGRLTSADRIQAYMRAVDAASDRVRVETIGTTEEGRDIILVIVADEAGIAGLERLKEATAALSDPRRTTPAQAEEILAAARPIYYFNCGQHADETGSPEMALELVYRLAVSDQPMIRGIRERVLTLVNPVAEPDGRTKVAEWYLRYLKGKTDYDALPRMSPPYWNRYVYVDINRDAHQQAFAVTRAVHGMFHDYHPTVVHDLHESIALLQTWNGTGPYNPHLDPIVTSQFLEMSFHEVTTLTAMGMPGVWTWDFGEGFGHHFLDSVAMNHNAIGRGYETFGSTTPETVSRTLDDGGTEQEAYLTREWFRPSPPPRAFRWSMRDNVNYQQTGALSILDWSARHAQEMLRNYYRTGYNSWQRGVNEPPYAFVIPEDQPDRLRVAGMINRLRDQRIEVGRLGAGLTVREGSFPRGAFIVRLDQPYRNYAVDLLEPQRFPAETDHLPYDDVSWAFPVGFGVRAVRIDDPRVKTAAIEPIRDAVVPAGRVEGRGPVFLIRDTGQEALLAARYRIAGFQVEIAERAFRAGGEDYPPGSWIVGPAADLRTALEAVARELAIDARAVKAAPAVPRHPAPPPRIGVWVPWADTDMMGWIRHTFDRGKIPYTYLRDEDVRAGRLRDRVDVILYGPFSRLTLEGQIHGIAPVAGPIPFTRTPEYPSHGEPVASDDITGGPGFAGLESIRLFVEAGGVLLTLGNGSELALEGGLVRGVRRAEGTRVFTPGSELRLGFARPDHPIAYGFGGEVSAFRTNIAVYDPPRRWITMAYCTSCLEGPVDRRSVVATWGGAGPMVVSGGMRGESDLAGRPAILDLPIGAGRVIAYNFNPIHRDMNRSDHRFVWNAILNWNALSDRGSR